MTVDQHTNSPADESTTTPGAAEHMPRWRERHIALVAGVAAIAVIGAAAIGFAAGRGYVSPPSIITDATAEPEQTRLTAAKQECAPHDSSVRLGDGGTSLIISRVAAEERPGAELEDLVCILLFIDVPDAVVSQMNGTRALDGRQQAAWGDFHASWTYHPDSGLDVILQETR